MARRQARDSRFLLPGAVGVEDEEGEVRHAGGEAEARGATGGAREVGLAAAVAAPAQRAAQQRRRWKEAEEGGKTHGGGKMKYEKI